MDRVLLLLLGGEKAAAPNRIKNTHRSSQCRTEFYHYQEDSHRFRSNIMWTLEIPFLFFWALPILRISWQFHLLKVTGEQSRAYWTPGHACNFSLRRKNQYKIISLTEK